MDLDSLLESFEKTENFYRDDVGEEKIVFIHDSCVRQRGQVFQFSDEEFGILGSLLSQTSLPLDSYQFVAAIKEIGATEDTVTTPDLHKNRPLLEEELREIKPTLIFLLGNLSMRTLLKKSGITNKRGKEFWLEMDDVSVPVVPVFHPFSLYSEPKLRPLFVQDVNNAYDKFILNKNKVTGGTHEVCMDVESALSKLRECLSKDVVAVDLETTGLDYKKDKITTLGISVGEEDAFVIPLYHKEAPFTDSELSRICNATQLLMASDTNKVFHNCKFDLKFLRNWGVRVFNNIDDTQIMHSLIDENLPHGLMDLVKEYFPQELEKF